MNEVLIQVLNMSLSASVIAVAVLFVRVLLCRAPKKYAYMLWAVVLFRLLCPFSIESAISLLPSATPIPQNIELAITPPPANGFPVVDAIVRQTIDSNARAVQAGNSMNPSQLIFALAAWVWVLGIVSMLLYALVSYARLQHRLQEATRIRDNLYESDRIATPFVLGVLRPRIYLPIDMDQSAITAVLLHEMAHIHRKDHIVKLLSFSALALHWFNPLVWICYFLACKDMEMSCDELVLRQAESDERTAYSSALLSLAAPRGAFPSPLAFGESDVKPRIKNILKWRSPKRIITILALIACILTIVVCAMNPKTSSIAIQPAEFTLDTQIGAGGVDIYYYDGKTAVFHDYFGLFVYDVTKQKIIRSVDVEPLGCNFTQGDQTCSIGVAPGGNTIYLNAIGSDINYVYLVSENKMYTEPAETRNVWKVNTNLDSMENVFGMGMAWPASAGVSYGCARTETEVAYLHRNSDTENTIRQLNLNVYNFETDRTIRYPLFRDAPTETVDGAMFANAFVPRLDLSITSDGNWNPYYITVQTDFENTSAEIEYPRDESYRQLLGNDPASEVHYADFPVEAECIFRHLVYKAPLSVQFFDSVLDEEGNILVTAEMRAPTQANNAFTGACTTSAAELGVETFLQDATSLHGISIRASFPNGDVFEYRFIARTDYK